MARDVHISLQRLLTGLIIVIVPLSVLGLYLTSKSDTNLREAVGTHLKTFAQTDAAVASQYISDRVGDVKAIAEEPAIVDAIIAANRAYERLYRGWRPGSRACHWTIYRRRERVS